MLCQVCGKNESKYTCPACNIKSCSLECVKKHKEQTGCTGVKPRTTFVPLEKMDSQMLMKDCVLIDEVRSAVIDADVKFPKNKKAKWQKLLEDQCKKGGTTICFMPRQMTRSIENKTRYNIEKDKIFWTCRFRFRNENKDIICDRLIHDIDETSKILDIFNALVETTPNDYVANATLDEFELLLVAEGTAGGGHYQLEPSATLGEKSFSKTIIEYPIFDIVPKSSLDEWNVVFFVGNFEEPKEQPTQSKKTELPSYEKIKDALKLDIITNVLKTSAQKEEQNAPLPPDCDSDMKNNDTPL